MSQAAAASTPQSAYECFEVEIKDKIAHIKLSRPDALNTMNKAFWRDLPVIVEDIDANAKARVIVISSTGKHFTAGMDLSVFGDGTHGGRKMEAARKNTTIMMAAQALQKTFSCLDEARVPVLMAVQGGCIGGGVDFASACDIRYATKDAFFCVQEINIGMTADVGTFPRLPHLLPQGLVRELSYTGRRMAADEAAANGFVTRVFDTHEEMLAGVMEIAREIASKTPLAIWGSKEMLNYSRDHSIADGLKHIAVWQAGMYQGTDMAEAFKAKMEKREPEFDDLPPIKNPMDVV